MSAAGIRRDLNGSSSALGLSAPGNRDAWNNPIEEPENKNPQTGQNGQGGDNKGSNGNNKNNDGIDADTIDSIWQDVRREGSEGADPKGVVTAPAAAGPTKTPQEQMDTYLKEIGLEPIVLSDTDKAAIQGGDFSGVLASLNQRIVQSHIKAISGSKQLIDKAVKEAVAQAVGDSKSYYEGREGVEALQTALPFTKDPAIGPIANTIMQRLLNKGASRDEAIKGVELWGKRFMSKFDPNYVPGGVNKNRNGSFGSSSSDGEAEVADWLDILRPQRR